MNEKVENNKGERNNKYFCAVFCSLVVGLQGGLKWDRFHPTKHLIELF